MGGQSLYHLKIVIKKKISQNSTIEWATIRSITRIKCH